MCERAEAVLTRLEVLFRQDALRGAVLANLRTHFRRASGVAFNCWSCRLLIAIVSFSHACISQSVAGQRKRKLLRSCCRRRQAGTAAWLLHILGSVWGGCARRRPVQWLGPTSMLQWPAAQVHKTCVQCSCHFMHAGSSKGMLVYLFSLINRCPCIAHKAPVLRLQAQAEHLNYYSPVFSADRQRCGAIFPGSLQVNSLKRAGNYLVCNCNLWKLSAMILVIRSASSLANHPANRNAFSQSPFQVIPA